MMPALTTERQLFVDDAFIDEQRGLTRRLHQPRRHEFNPILVAAYPWEGDRVMPGAVLRNPRTGQFQLWYCTSCVGKMDTAQTPEEKDRVAGYVCYAESDDGLHWRRPALGVQESSVAWKLPWEAPPQADRTRQNNILMRSLALGGAERPELGLEFLCRDEQEPDPARRYKALIWQQGDRYKELDERGAIAAGKMLTAHCAAFSADGIHWTQSGPVLTYPRFRDAGSAMQDWKNRRFVGFFKTALRERRTRAVCVSQDLIHWSEPEVILEADEHDPRDAQIYDNSGFIYESLYLGTLGLFRAGDEATIQQQLTHSRDGLHWVRGFDRQTFFPHGQPGADWDGGLSLIHI